MAGCSLTGDITIDGTRGVNTYQVTIEQGGRPLEVLTSDYGRDGTLDAMGYSKPISSPGTLWEGVKKCESSASMFVRKTLPAILSNVLEGLQCDHIRIVSREHSDQATHSHFTGSSMLEGIDFHLSDFDNDGHVDELRLVAVDIHAHD